jgi:thiamine biosynthesis lipoprotein
LVRLWTEAGRSDTLPTPEALAAARGRVGASGIVVDGGRAGLARAGMSLDLGGLAKGWALDRAGEILRRRGVTRALLSFGQSSLLALGHPPAGEGWRVLVRDPRGDYAGVVSLRDLRLSVSGSFGASSVIQGRRFGHVLDPRSGWPLTRAAQAVVLAPNGALAEALGKALLVLKPEESLALLASLEGVEGLLIGEGGDLARSGGFDAATSWQPLARKATEPR